MARAEADWQSTVSKSVIRIAAFACFLVLLVGIGKYVRSRSSEADTKTVRVDELQGELQVFDTVFWEPLDTESLRSLIKDSPLVDNKSVLEIGTGTGLIAICCSRYGAARVVATDINPHAVACAKSNATQLGYHQIDVRLVSADDPSAYSTIGKEEMFDLIVSNPPWENGKPNQWSDYALYDPEFALLKSILEEGRNHLAPEGKIMLAYGCVEAIRNIHTLADELNYQVIPLDDRDYESLPDVFLPGYLIGLVPEDH